MILFCRTQVVLEKRPLNGRVLPCLGNFAPHVSIAKAYTSICGVKAVRKQ